MPQALAVVIGNVVGAVVGSAVVGAIVQAGVMALLTRFLTKRPGAQWFPLNVTVRSTVAPRRLLFGTVRAAGAALFIRTSGSNNQYLHYVIAYAGHQCSAMKDLYLDKFKIAAADINGATGNVSTAVLDGKLKVQSARYLDPARAKPLPPA